MRVGVGEQLMRFVTVAQLKWDYPVHHVTGKPIIVAAYRPIPYEQGRICEACWLNPREPFAYADANDWPVRAVGRDGCPHDMGD